MAPRLSASPRKNKSLPSPAPARSGPAPMGDNSKHGDEAERVQLISFVAKRSQAKQEVERAKGPYDAAKKGLSSVNNLAKAAGFTVKELEAREEEMNRSDAENVQVFARETRHRRWLGSTSEEQVKMHLEGSTPKETMDAMDWQSRGYRDGLRGMEGKLPEGCPPRMDQPYMKGHGTGYAEYLESLKANAPKAMGSVRDQAAADFAADNKPEPGSPEAAAAERKAIRAAKAGLEKMAERQPEAEPEGQKPTDPDAGFEAAAEELAGAGPADPAATTEEPGAGPADDDGTAHPCPDCGALAGVPCEPDCPSEAEPV